MNSFIESCITSQKNKKAQKNNRKCSDNDISYYSHSFKRVSLKPKRSQIGVPRTEVIVETTVNGSKKPLRILIDTDISSSII
jgi:hypothetical protein